MQNTQNNFSLKKILIGSGIVFVLALAVFSIFSWNRLNSHSTDNHYVYLADSLIHGRLHIEGKPPHLNDWAKYNDKWYVSFPPIPAVLMIPGVYIWGMEFNDVIFTLVFAAAGPALLYMFLSILAVAGRIKRAPWEIAVLTLLFAEGTVYFFCAVQGTVWYTAHMVGVVMLILSMIFAVKCRHPVLSGLFLVFAAACRPPLILGFGFFLYELIALNASDSEKDNFIKWIKSSLGNKKTKAIIKKTALFVLPIALVGVILMILNDVRFDDPMEFGHKYLKVRWAGRIEKWGLFNYHFLGRNLAILLSSIPWITSSPPYIGISMHGLALWFTTPVFLLLLWPGKKTVLFNFCLFTFIIMALPGLFYQNSGWVQFGYRFSLDFTVYLILLLAVSKIKFKKLFFAMLVFGVFVNAFGAYSFNREWKYYPRAGMHNIFQPD